MAPDLVTAVPDAWHLREPDRGRRNLAALGNHLGPDDLRPLVAALGRLLPRNPDPDMALNNLERVLASPAGREHLPHLTDGRSRTLDTLLGLLGTSQFLADVLANDPAALDALRGPWRRTPTFAELHAQLAADVAAATDDASVLRAFRRFRQRQTVRIGANDIVRDRPLDDVARDLSRVAEVAIEVALAHALHRLTDRFGEPAGDDHTPARVVVLAFGKLGGEELNYSSDIDLMFVYDHEGETTGRRSISNDEFYARAVGEVVRLLSARTAHGQAYRVDLRLRPEGQRGPLARTLASTLSYYDAMGRTWERQALIKARPVAGDFNLGTEFVQAVEPFVYRKYFSFSEINEIKAMKRKLERKAAAAGVDESEVKTGRGGIRDIEFTVQFLQLLNGGDSPEVRQRNTLAAVQALTAAGCLTDQEAAILDDTYRFLRKTEHRLQLLFDLQTHRLPDSADALRQLARRMGYEERGSVGAWSVEREEGDSSRSTIHTPTLNDAHSAPQSRRPAELEEVPAEPGLHTRDLLIDPLDRFLHDYQAKTRLNRTILDHLLHQTFEDDADDGQAAPETDLILDPQPDDATVQAVLGKYPFRDVRGAYQNLALLARESVQFLSERRCRHFLASIAPRLLRAVAETPDSDLALTNLEKVTASLGAKAVLYELFSFNPPSLKLYVDLCAGSQFLSEILINNPGMIDDLLDTLVLNRPRPAEELRAELAALCQGAADVEPILHSFQDKELLRIGVADLLGKAPITDTTAALSDLAETILAQVVALQGPALAPRFGAPSLSDGRPCRFAILALGKLGGRELSYHSDLDLVLVYEGDGRTRAAGRPDERFAVTDNLHYFSELLRRVIRVASTHGPLGRLYHIDMRLRPTGGSGSLAVSLAEFRRYYACGGGQLWERQALTKARLVAGNAHFGAEVAAAARRAAFEQPWQPAWAGEIVAMRERLEASRPARDLKRGWGGLADVEFLVQLFQLKYGGTHADLQTPNTRTALDALLAAGLLNREDHAALRAAYDFLRLVESRLRVVTNRAADALPESPADLDKLARRLGCASADRFLADFEGHTAHTRAIFRRLCKRERG